MVVASSDARMRTIKIDRVLTLTDFTIDGRPHSVLSSLLLWRRPCLSTARSKTSTPKTLGFMGLGYFCIAALVTVSQGWLVKRRQKKKNVTQMKALYFCSMFQGIIKLVKDYLYVIILYTFITPHFKGKYCASLYFSDM